jgi:hypothetical protein
MNEEQRIQEEIMKMREQNPNLSVVDVADRFGKSYFWAYSRMNPRYMSQWVRGQLKGMCGIKHCVPFKTSEFTGNYYCERCRESVAKEHFRRGKA